MVKDNEGVDGEIFDAIQAADSALGAHSRVPSFHLLRADRPLTLTAPSSERETWDGRAAPDMVRTAVIPRVKKSST